MNAKRIIAATTIAAALVGGIGSAAHADMQERSVATFSRSVPTPVSVNAVRLEAGPRQLDPRFYDVLITIAGQPQPMISVFTGTTARLPRIDQELVRTAGTLADLTVDVSYLYDTAKAVCAASVGSTCAANLPFDVTQPGTTALTTTRSELVIEAGVAVNGATLDTQLVKIPFLGQVTAIVPDNNGDQ